VIPSSCATGTQQTITLHVPGFLLGFENLLYHEYFGERRRIRGTGRSKEKEMKA
jgi:hypothetical protein